MPGLVDEVSFRRPLLWGSLSHTAFSEAGLGISLSTPLGPLISCCLGTWRIPPGYPIGMPLTPAPRLEGRNPVLSVRASDRSSLHPYFFFSLLLLQHMEVPRLGVKSKLPAEHHSHGNTESELYLWPTPEFVAMMDPLPTEGSQGSNLHLHRQYVWFLTHWTTIEPLIISFLNEGKHISSAKRFK